MAYNHNGGFCRQCSEFVYKGDGLRLWDAGTWRTFCLPCATARQENKNKAVKKAAYIKRQPTLFD